MDDFQLRFCLFLLLFFNCSLVSAYQRDGPAILTQSDHQVLMSLKHELVDSRGVLSSWNATGPTPCSAWAGIKCVNGQVIAIQLPWKGLGGRLSDKIGHLKALRRLSLHNNLLVGPVPASLGSLPSLRGVYLFNNRLSGFIPPSIGNCPFLQTFDVSNNRLTGIIPPSLANSTRLYRLNLSFNGLSGLIPASLSQSSSLTFLALQNNNLSGSVPDSWDSLSVNRSYQLRSLALDHNSLSGKIPSSLKNLTMLEELNLSHNKIEGLIPDELGSLSRLNSIDLSNNAINGSLPESFSKLSSLASMNLENNHLDSQIPESISQLRNLSLLNLSANKFEGQIPVFTGNMTFLDLSKNDLTGEIPVSLVNLPNLSSFNVSYNNLSGAVPSSLAKKFNSTSFVGNIQLCGYTGSSPCPSPGPDHNVPSPSQGEINHHRRRKLSTKDIILIAAGSLLIVLLILCCVLFLCFLIRKKAASKTKKGKTGVSASMGVGTKPVVAAGNEPVLGSETGGKLVHFDGPFVFTADDLLCATAETMGKSPYGTAYKATLEDSDHHVAVKRLREKITKAQKEFESEVSALGKIRHPNIVALRAFYLGPKGEKLLVYDYMPNGSLASFLHARGPETSMPLQTRMNIAIGITRGLCFLHTEQNIVHGNLTSSNILLDEHNNPKISEVGLSRLVTSTVSANLIATAGTMGYRAPEFSKLKNANTKTDVFSLGMIMLELLTGKSPSETKDELDLAQWAASTMKEERTSEVFDVELARDASSSNGGDEMLNVLKLALHCVDPSPAARPEAQQVLQKLEEMKPEKGDVTTGPASE